MDIYCFLYFSGLLGTPLGEKMWTANVKQIVEATTRSIQLAIMNLAIMQETYFSALVSTRMRNQSEAVRSRQIMATQAQLFGCVQKKYGLEHALGGMMSIFKDRGVKPTMAIVPADTAALLRCRTENRDFMINGALAQMYQIDPQRQLSCYVHSTSLAMFEHRGYFADQQEMRANVLVRDREIGQYFIMKYDPNQAIVRGIRGQRDIMVIDHNRQRWVRIGFIEALKASGMFNTDEEGSLTEYGRKILCNGGSTFGAIRGVHNGKSVNTAQRATAAKRAAPVASRKAKRRVGAQAKTGVREFTLGDETINIDKTQLSDYVSFTNGNWKFIDNVFNTQLGNDTKTAINDDVTKETKQALGFAYGKYNNAADENQREIVKTNLKSILEAFHNGKINPDDKPFLTGAIKFDDSGVNDATDKEVPDGPGAYMSTTNTVGAGETITIKKIEESLNDGKNVPISLYILRPNVSFRMGGMVVAVGGEETGFTVIGNSNFELSDEATTKTALGHYTTYFKPIIHTRRNVMVCPDAVFQGYLAGGGTKMCLPEQYEPSKVGGDPVEYSDMVVMPTSADDPMDGIVPLTGTFDNLSSNFQALESVTSGDYKAINSSRKDFAYRSRRNVVYSTATEGAGDTDLHAYGERYRGHNLLCFQGRQKCMGVTGMGGADFIREIKGRGHLSGIEYEDSSIREFTGNMSFREEPNLRVESY